MVTINKTIENLKPGKQYLVTVRPKDADLNLALSPVSAIRFTVPSDATRPADLGNLVIVGNYKSIMISFNPSNEADLSGYNYEVYLSENIALSGSMYVIVNNASPYISGFSGSNVIAIDVPQNSETTNNVNANTGVTTTTTTPKLYFGRVQSVDTTGNTSGWTPVVASTATTLIDSAHIIDLTASKITAGTIGAHTITMAGVNSILKSSNYQAANTTFGGTGWKISGDGKAVFNDASIRSSLDIGEDQGTSDATSFHVDANGNMWSGANSTSFAVAPFRVTNTGEVTARTLTLTGNTILSQTDDSKIYLGVGVYNNTNTPFYVDSDSQFSLGNKLTWDGTTLSITGNVVITGGSTLTLINAAQADADAAQATADNAIPEGFAASDINTHSTTIDGGKITTGSINANRIVAGSIEAIQISASYVYAGTINADNINAGTLTGRAISGGTITGGDISGGTITGGAISGGTITGGSISGGSITGSTISTGSGVGSCSFGISGFSRVNGIGFINQSTSGWDTNFYPYTPGDKNCGTSGYYWNNVNYSGSLVKISDRRIKDFIEDTPSVLGLINALKPRVYLMKNSPGDSKVVSADPETNQWEYEPVGAGKRKHFGLIAQEVKEAFEQSGFSTTEYSGWGIADKDNPDSQQNINLDEFIGILIKSVQELSAKVEELESKLS